MIRNQKVIGIIPARGGSKGIPGKNLKPLGGKPLIAHTISAALSSKYIDKVIMTTDSEEIAKVALSYGAEVPFLRPAELALDTSKSIEALVHARDWLVEHDEPYDIAVWLQPTSPLRRGIEIDGAIEQYCKFGGELGVVSVSEVIENPVLTRRMDEYGILHSLLPTTSTVRRQDMPRFYRVDGAINVNDFTALNLDTSLNDNPLGYLMPRERSVDIDTLEDFERAEKLLRELS